MPFDIDFDFTFGIRTFGDAAPPPAALESFLIVFDGDTNNSLIAELNGVEPTTRSDANDWVTLIDQNGTSAPTWASDSGGSTGSSNTGPPANNPYTFLFTETSGSNQAGLNPDPMRMRIANDVFATATDRTIRFLYNLYGREFTTTGTNREGVEIIFEDADGNVVGNSYWLDPWNVENNATDIQGGNIIWNAGTERTPLITGPGAPEQAAGWADSGDIPVPAEAAEVLVVCRYHDTGSNNFEHDMSFRSLNITYRPGTSATGAFDDSFEIGEEYT